ncbi:ATP-dependent DNA ligase [Pseudomonas guariconensis]|uniref:ATP-dependent DNA ligase n=1 Tax=Pseudomonas guariconensis TaxID=1288410 RepID=UPI003905FBC5
MKHGATWPSTASQLTAMALSNQRVLAHAPLTKNDFHTGFWLDCKPSPQTMSTTTMEYQNVLSTAIYEALEQIANTSGKNDKLALLKGQVSNDVFQRTLNYMLNPFITYGIRPARATQFGDADFTADTWALLDQLAARELTGNRADVAVTQALSGLNPASSELLWRIISKDPRAGFSESSVNKVHPGLIPEFSYMRCSLPHHTKLAEWNWAAGVYSQVKADGMFVNVTVEDGVVTITSRSGSVLPLLPFQDLLDGLSQLPNGQCHGELLVESDGQVLAREVGNGMLNSVVQGGQFDMGCRPIIKLWDQIPLESVKKSGRCETPYKERFSQLASLVEALGNSAISMIETRIVYSLSEALDHYSAQLELDLEGTILKKHEAVWFDGTSREQVKLKLDAPCELEVIDFLPGKGANAKTFGSLLCKSACGKLVVAVSGFTKKKREEIHLNRDTWLGMIITVKANQIMRPKKPGKPYSLFLPRFVEERLDKTVADDLARIEEQFENAIKGVSLGIAA